ncbi:hypothetical protein [Rhizobium sp. BE258]|uniref:hypothetical protein n=1 Tax=Rhizobium sp. BE258 TaxID=2817722 RepID=UPI0028559DD7|nr:hypothetical protein [Rhizobium sp. BE258]MDR7147162.1 hypothetical protein [Rhizobium sp. BE258]
MFAVANYYAERQVYTKQDDGTLKSSWNPCRVIGVKEEDGEPAYIVEYVEGGITHLGTETYLKHTSRGNPL